MSILVTGGAGFIGSRLAARLLAAGEQVVILDNFNTYYDPAIKRENIASLNKDKLVLVEGDVRDEALMKRVFAEYHVHKVAHLAAMAGMRFSADQARLYAEVNTTGSVVLMDAARKHNVEVFVQASTSSVYGQTLRIPFKEEDPADWPLAPYPASKRAAEIFAHSFHHLFGLNVTVLRFFNVYGPHGRPDMMPIKVIEAMVNDQPITVFDGGDLQRDWTYIDDTVDGIIAALNRPLGFRIINLGRGEPVSLTTFIQIYEELIGKSAIIQKVAAPLTEHRISYCDNTLAQELLGFAPKVHIADGLSNTWDWYRKRRNAL
jgi:UDP-glucuronate 4-epimerase